MEKRPLGMSGLEVSVLSFGTATFTGNAGRHAALGSLDEIGATRMVDICIDAGVTLFDTASSYSDGVAEMLLGTALGSRRNDVILATKAFHRTGPSEVEIGNSRQNLIAACEASLRRLGTDRIDLFQLHNFDALIPVEETLHALDHLVQSGKVRHVGCSNFGAWQLMKTLGIASAEHLPFFASHQLYYSLLCRDAEHDLIPAGYDQNVGTLVWGGLASGYLTGKIRRGQAAPPGTRIEAMGTGSLIDPQTADDIVDVVLQLAAERGVTPSQVAINWLLRKSGVTSVILGARNEAQLFDTLAAASFCLTREEVDRLDAVSAPSLRYPVSHQRSSHGDGRNPPLPSYRL